MRTEQFIVHYPLLYHMAHESSLESILERGLLSTTALLDLFEVNGAERYIIENCRRAESVEISHPKYGIAIIRDQKPLNDAKLTSCLNGCTPEDWYKKLNQNVFFWPTEERVRNLLSARAYRKKKHLIFLVNSEALLEEYSQNILLTPINTGAVIYGGTPRGLSSFVPISDWPNYVGPRSGKLLRPVTEVAIDYGVRNIKKFMVRVVEGENGILGRTLWEP